MYAYNFNYIWFYTSKYFLNLIQISYFNLKHIDSNEVEKFKKWVKNNKFFESQWVSNRFFEFNIKYLDFNWNSKIFHLQWIKNVDDYDRYVKPFTNMIHWIIIYFYYLPDLSTGNINTHTSHVTLNPYINNTHTFWEPIIGMYAK